MTSRSGPPPPWPIWACRYPTPFVCSMVDAGERWFPLEMNAPSVITSSAVAERDGRRARALASIDDFIADLRNRGD